MTTSPIAVKDASAYAQMLVQGIADATGGDATALVEAIDRLASAASEGASFDLDEAVEKDYQEARKAALDAINADTTEG